MPTVTAWRSKRGILSERDLAILRAVATYRFMRADDVAQLLSRAASLNHVREDLRRLSGGDCVNRQFLYRFPVPTTTKGTKIRAYALGAKGREALAEEGYSRPYLLRSLSYGYIWHALTLTRVLCAAHAWCRQHDVAYRLTQGTLSYELSATIPLVPIETEGQSTREVLITYSAVVPDAFVCFERVDGKKFPILLEIDRGTEYQERFKQHVRGRIELIRSGVYLQAFQIPAVLVAYATTGALSHDNDRQTRRATMERWTREVVVESIDEEDREGWLAMFRFCTLPADIYANTKRLFSEASWHQPQCPTPLPLLPS